MTIYRRRLASSLHALAADAQQAAGGRAVRPDRRGPVPGRAGRRESWTPRRPTRSPGGGLVAEERASILGLLKRIARLGTDTKVRRLKAEIERRLRRRLPLGHRLHPVHRHDGLPPRATWPPSCRACRSPATPAGAARSATWAATGTSAARSRSSSELEGRVDPAPALHRRGGRGPELPDLRRRDQLDLPWNPMKVEQRIGRIDRIGQKYPIDPGRQLRLRGHGRGRRLLRPRAGGSTCSRGSSASSSRSCRGCPRSSRRSPWSGPSTARRPGSGSWPMSRAWSTRPRGWLRRGRGRRRGPRRAGPSPAGADLTRPRRRPEPPGCPPTGGGVGAARPGLLQLRLPGSAEWVRVTTSAEVFDDHFESHEFLSPGGRLFEALSDLSAGDAPEADGRRPQGYCWLTETDGCGHGSELLVLTPSGADAGPLARRTDRPPRQAPHCRGPHPRGPWRAPTAWPRLTLPGGTPQGYPALLVRRQPWTARRRDRQDGGAERGGFGDRRRVRLLEPDVPQVHHRGLAVIGPVEMEFERDGRGNARPARLNRLTLCQSPVGAVTETRGVPHCLTPLRP